MHRHHHQNQKRRGRPAAALDIMSLSFHASDSQSSLAAAHGASAVETLIARTVSDGDMATSVTERSIAHQLRGLCREGTVVAVLAAVPIGFAIAVPVGRRSLDSGLDGFGTLELAVGC